MNQQKLKTLPHRLPFYYGWVIVILGTVVMIMSIPGQTMGVSPLTNQLIELLSIKRTHLTFAYLIGTLISSLFLPWVGRVLDRKGPQFMIAVSTIGLASSLMLIVATTKIVTYYNLPSWVSLIMATIFFLGIRQFGQGQMTMIGRTIIGKWFETRRGLAFGINGIFVALGFGIAPQMLHLLLSKQGFNSSLMTISALVILTGIISYIFFRDTPESCGLAMEKRSKVNQQISCEDTRQEISEVSWPATEAKKTAAFWAFNLGNVAQAMLITAVTFHIAAIAEEQGVGVDKAFSLFLPTAIISTVGSAIGSWLSDRTSIRWHLTIMCVHLTVALVLINYLNTVWGFYGTAFCLGISGGLFACLTAIAWPKLYGRKHLGAINGFATSSMVFGSALGPYIYSIFRSDSAGFSNILLGSACFPLILAIFSLIVPMPDKDHHRR